MNKRQKMEEPAIPRSKRSKIPQKVFENLRSAGAVVEKLEGESLYSINNIVYGDKAWWVYRDWAIGIDDGPQIIAAFFPSAAIRGTAICPPLHLGIPIQVEASSLIFHYSTLCIQDFADGNGPVIGDPVRAPQMLTKVYHAAIAVTKMMEAIQSPPRNYPLINSLISGSYICTVNQQWANAGVVITLFKP